MNKPQLFLTTALLLAACAAQAASPLRFSLVKTTEMSTPEALVYAGGEWLKSQRMTTIAVLVSHPQGDFLFDAGLGREIDSQFSRDMPWWGKLLFNYGPVSPARDQLEAQQYPLPPRIILSHAHWDHASGLVDFPDAQVWLPQAEHQFSTEDHPGAILPSQVGSAAIRWHRFAFDHQARVGFERSLDIYGDGSAILVDLSGHTPGSTGLLLTTISGQRYLFIGDTVWDADALTEGAPKFWLASNIVDHDHDATGARIQQIRARMQADPALVVVPAHDADVQDALGYFPGWIE